MSDYPKFMCRAGGSEEAWGILIESGSAVDEADEMAKLEDGWVYRPDEIEAPTTVEVEAVARKQGRPAKGE